MWAGVSRACILMQFRDNEVGDVHSEAPSLGLIANSSGSQLKWKTIFQSERRQCSQCQP